MTVASVVARAFGIAVPLPFLYAALPVEAVAFWLSVITFQALVGAFAGIVPTVVMQMVAYAHSGSSSVSGTMEDHAQDRTAGPNADLIAKINRASIRVFWIIALVWLGFAGVVGTFVLWRPMMASGTIPDAGTAWVVFIIGSAARLLALPYGAYGQGVGAVAAVRRSESYSWIMGGAAAVVVLWLVPNLTLAMIAIQAPAFLNYVQFHALAKRLGWRSGPVQRDASIVSELWSRSWRGGIASLATVLTLYGTGFIYAQVGSSQQTANYLFGLNVLGIVGQVASSFVIAASPFLAARYAQGDLAGMTSIAQRAIGRSMSIFVLLAISAPVGITIVNQFLPVPVGFPEGQLWLAMCLSAIMLRHSADHLLYYTITNDIRGHIINPIFLAASLAPFLVLPASNLLLLVAVQGGAAALFHFPYARWLTRAHLGYGIRRELPDFLLPLAVMLAALASWAALCRFWGEMPSIGLVG